MSISADQITIAVTVYDPRQYLVQAVERALNQTVPVKVMVVEDCGPDAGLREFVRAQFGERVGYHRNAQRQGLFDTWNACVELCSTHRLSILHDDVFLETDFIAIMLKLGGCHPGLGLYFGRALEVDEHERLLRRPAPQVNLRHGADGFGGDGL